MAKRENEAVVNRFLLSTLYAVVGEFVIFYLYKMSVTSSVLITHLSAIFNAIMALGIASAVWFAIKHWVLKNGGLYHFGVFIIVAFTGAFLNYYPGIDFFFLTYRRFVVVALVVAAVYVYEIVRYFLKVNK